MTRAVSAVFLLSRAAMLGDAIALAERMLVAGRFRVTFVLSGELIKTNVAFRTEYPKPSIVKDASYRVLPRGLGRLGPFRLMYLLWRFIWRRLAIRDLIFGLRPSVVVVFEDRILDPEAIWLRQLDRAGIPAVLVRYASSSNESDFWGRRGQGAYSLHRGLLAPLRRGFGQAHPEHVRRHGSESLLFYPLWESLALKIAGMADVNPWVVGGGCVARVALQGHADRLEAENSTGNYGRFVVTGQPIWDVLADGNGKHGIEHGSNARILCAVPQWAEHHQLPWDIHMRFIETLMRILSGCGGRAVLSLHPKADKATYSPLAERFGLTISEEPLIAHLKSADIFVASWSSTIRWAAMLGIPSINIDWAGQSYSLFEQLVSMPGAPSPDDFERELKGYIADPERRLRIGAALRSEAAVYGSIDGKACQRIIDLISDVLATPREQIHG